MLLDCVFCNEEESLVHLFFNCVVARNNWPVIAKFFAVHIGNNFESIARFWYITIRTLISIPSAMLYCVVFENAGTHSFSDNVSWMSSTQVWSIILTTVQRWLILGCG